ncbi:MAG: hypothetical protein AB7D07_03985 [Desulfovibrionaceae bacterium]
MNAVVFFVVFLLFILAGPAAAQNDSLGRTNLEQEDALVYSSYWQQKVYAERCFKACPPLAPRLYDALSDFKGQFGPSVEAVERLVAKPGETPEQTQARFRSKWEKDADTLNFSCAPCNNTLSIIQARAKGLANSPLREALLRNHPEFAKRPDRMMAKGFVKQLVHTDPLSGLELILDYPATWKETPAPAGASAVYSDNGHGFERLLLFTAPHPDLMEKNIDNETSLRVLDEAVDELMDERWCGESKGCQAGKMQMDGRPARWFVQKREKPGVYLMQTLWVYTVIGNRLAALQMDVRSATPSETPASVEQRFSRYMPAFLRMAESMRVVKTQ